jgi:predicted transcriptional regulator
MKFKSTTDGEKVLDGIYQARNKAINYLINHPKSTVEEIGNYVGCMSSDVATILLPFLVDINIVKSEVECRGGSPVKTFSVVDKQKAEQIKKTLEEIYISY